MSLPRFIIPLLAIALLASGPRPAVAEPVHGLSMHGDLAYPPDFTHYGYVNPEAPKGGEMRQGTMGTFDNFNQFIVKGSSASGLAFLYDTLLDFPHDEPFSGYGRLAESLETPPDRSWVEFTLREGARWHDGQPVTVDDVIWTFHALVEKGSPLYRFYYAGVDEVAKTGPRTVRFTFQPGDNRELPLILGQFPILPKHYWESRDFSKTTLEPPLGSGPYRLAEFEAGRFVSYERVESYWGRDLPVIKGRFNFDRLRVDYFRDLTVALEAFKGGQFDFRAESNSKDWATGYDTPNVRNGRIQKREVPHTQPAGMQGFVYNTRREMFQDPRVRQALAYAFDFEWSNKTLFYGQYTRTRSYFENSELASRGLPDADELALLEPHRGMIPDEVFTAEYQPPTSDGSGNIRANLKQAVGLLAQAGWKVKDGSMVHEGTGNKLEFEILLVQPGFERICLPFAKNLERIGVAATVRTVDPSQYKRRMDTYDFDMTVETFAQSRSPGNEQRDFWGAEAASREGGRNVIGIRDPVVDTLVEELIAAPDRKSLVVRTRALDRVLLWGHYVVPQWHISVDRIAYWDKFGYPSVVPDDGVQVDTWWVDSEKAAALAMRAGR